MDNEEYVLVKEDMVYKARDIADELEATKKENQKLKQKVKELEDELFDIREAESINYIHIE